MTTVQTNHTEALTKLRDLPRRLCAQDEFRAALDELDATGRASFEGVVGASRTLVATALQQATRRQIIIICGSSREMDEIADEWQLFHGNSPVLFPPWEAETSDRDISDDVFGLRLRTLKALLRDSPPDTIITSIQSLQQTVPAPQLVAQQTRVLRVGERIELEGFRRWLAENGFHPSTAVALPGEFSWRGGILDVFAADWDQPVRIELFDDEVESLRQFDPATQRSSQTVEAIELTVASPAGSLEHTLADFLPSDALVMWLEPAAVQRAADEYRRRLDHDDNVLSSHATIQAFDRFPQVTAAAVAGGGWDANCRLPIETVEHFSGEVGRVRAELDHVAAGHDVIIVSQTDAEAQRLAELLAAGQVGAEGRLLFAVGGLYGGFRLIAEKTLVLSGSDLFHRTLVRRAPRRRHASRPLDSFLELREGDLVVHLSHGIGRYRGIRLLERGEHAEEHLTIEFDAGVKVFVPASRIYLVQKYVGGTKNRPALAKLGGKSWVRQKQAAEAAVLDVAAEMLELQAARMARAGITFAPDSEWQREFDAAFPYQETPDQLTAIEAIKRDMEASRPMDRLLCGDVGFGKTELAMRAAFKAVESGYQVAVLVPTTVLAEQHYHTFTERMAEFPLDIAKLSRFCTPAEQREVIQGLAAGRIDIVIGTHRLASKDVQFDNLGLVIIDEEQRFGVEVKERLKTLRTTVDVLTLTATPIPRTLHMALVGVRDISNLETPPEDRMSVETKVTRWNNELIRHAILRELSRGGQIYFVHNRVHDIDVVARKLRQLAPEARAGIAHGQLHEHELERVMVDFVAGKFDLLLATTIVESGLDIPNANTIFIDEADIYGLADMHQLRGRVGRYKHRAYCYLLLDPNKHITPNATRRLLAIEEFSEMGAGFAISMRDLEIRGAGNLLGTQQSGHIAAVGYELYCQLLENAVRALQKKPQQLSLDVEIDLPLPAFLPTDYVDDMRAKIDLYRRLSRANSYEQVEEIRREMQDRFGALPAQAEGMLELAKLRIDAALWLVHAIYIEDDFLVFKFSDRNRIAQLARNSRHQVRIVDDSSAYIPLPSTALDGQQLLALSKSVLRAR